MTSIATDRVGTPATLDELSGPTPSTPRTPGSGSSPGTRW